MKTPLDAIDVKILKILKENSRLSYAEVGRKINLSQSATKERIVSLIDNKVIKDFDLNIDYGQIGYGLNVIISIKFENRDFEKFINDLHKFPEILNCKRVTGEFCLLTECVLKDSSHLEKLINRIIPYGTPSTSVILSEVKTNNFFN
ncbi:MAG: Lrp/AsnC family transcriptional regulator [Weeksellaceae bacterium]